MSKQSKITHFCCFYLYFLFALFLFPCRSFFFLYKAVPLFAFYEPKCFQETEASKFLDCPPLSSRKYSWYSFLLEAESTPGPLFGSEGLCQRQITITPSAIEPATFRFVAQCLNQLHHRVKRSYIKCLSDILDMKKQTRKAKRGNRGRK